MLFRFIELYRQGQDFKKDPIAFGTGLGADALAAMFVVPVIAMAGGSLAMMALWWWTGWGIFVFCAFVFWLGILFVHSMNVITSRVLGRAETLARKQYSQMHKDADVSQGSSTHSSQRHIIDVDSRG